MVGRSVGGRGTVVGRKEGVGVRSSKVGDCVVVITSVISRTLFYALVIPTTMPGAFFWKNQAFQDHAKETGLAEMPQVGVAFDTH